MLDAGIVPGIVGALLYYTFLIGTMVVAARGLRLARRIGDVELVRLGRGFLAATWASIASCIFLSGQYQELLWLLLACCLGYAAMVRRRAAAVLQRELPAPPPD